MGTLDGVEDTEPPGLLSLLTGASGGVSSPTNSCPT